MRKPSLPDAIRRAYPSATESDLAAMRSAAESDPAAPWLPTVTAAPIEPDPYAPKPPEDDEAPLEESTAYKHNGLPVQPPPAPVLSDIARLENLLLWYGLGPAQVAQLLPALSEFVESRATTKAAEALRHIMFCLDGTAAGVALRVAVLGPEGRGQRELAAEGGVRLSAIQKHFRTIARRIGWTNHTGKTAKAA